MSWPARAWQIRQEYALLAGMSEHELRDSRKIFRQLAENLASYPAYTKEDLARIPNPTFLIAGGNDLWGNLDQMVDMKRAIPNAELLLVNNAPHEVQHTHSWIVGPQVLDFLARNPC